MTNIQYRIKQVYGTDTMYPANEVAMVIASLTGKKTLSESDIQKAAKLGFTAERVF